MVSLWSNWPIICSDFMLVHIPFPQLVHLPFLIMHSLLLWRNMRMNPRLNLMVRMEIATSRYWFRCIMFTFDYPFLAMQCFFLRIHWAICAQDNARLNYTVHCRDMAATALHNYGNYVVQGRSHRCYCRSDSTINHWHVATECYKSGGSLWGYACYNGYILLPRHLLFSWWGSSPGSPH